MIFKINLIVSCYSVKNGNKVNTEKTKIVNFTIGRTKNNVFITMANKLRLLKTLNTLELHFHHRVP